MASWPVFSFCLAGLAKFIFGGGGGANILFAFENDRPLLTDN